MHKAKPRRGERTREAAKKPAPDRALEEKLFRAGLRAFAARGYAEVSADAIAREAGATKPMLYYYYGSKAGLYRAVAERAFTVITPERSRAADEHAPPVERLRAYVRDDFQRMREDPDIARFLYRTAYATSEAAPAIDHWALFAPSFQLVMAIVEAAQHKKLIAPGPPAELALPLFGLMGIYTQLHLAGVLGDMLSDARADELVDRYLFGVAKPR